MHFKIMLHLHVIKGKPFHIILLKMIEANMNAEITRAGFLKWSLFSMGPSACLMTTPSLCEHVILIA